MTLVEKIVLMLVVAIVVSIGFYIRPGAKKPIAWWQLTSVFVIGLIVAAVLLTTHSLYLGAGS